MTAVKLHPLTHCILKCDICDTAYEKPGQKDKFSVSLHFFMIPKTLKLTRENGKVASITL